MRVLLAGATGAIGQRLDPQLRAAGHEVVGLARSDVADISVDLLDRAATVRALEGQRFDAVIHLATAMGTSPATHHQMLRTNRLRSEGTSTLVAVAQLTGARRFVTASSFLGYGFMDHGEAALDEDAPFGLPAGNANDEVLRALLMNEQQARARGGIALRYGVIYGDRRARAADSSYAGVLPLLHIEDAATAALKALTRGKKGHAYNIADDHPASWRELQKSQARIDGHRPAPAVPTWLLRASAPYAAGVVTRTSMRLTTEKARRELSWRPKYPSFADGLASSAGVLEH